MAQTNNITTVTQTLLSATPQALLSSSADLSPGLPLKQHQLPPPSPTSLLAPPTADEITPRPRQPSRTPSLLNTAVTNNSRPASQISQTSTNSPLCTPKIKDFAYPKQHKYHAPPFNTRRYSISSRSSTSSDLDSFFPSRGGNVGGDGVDDGWREDEEGEDEEVVERRAVCVFDFEAECEGEMTIESGQVVWVEFRKGVSGWLVVRDEITGINYPIYISIYIYILPSIPLPFHSPP
jgi:hypothetical protein